jgi:hypothetical protein
LFKYVLHGNRDDALLPEKKSSFLLCLKNSFDLTIVAKVGGLQSQGAKGEAVVNLLRTLGNAGSGVLRLSRRVNNMASN